MLQDQKCPQCMLSAHDYAPQRKGTLWLQLLLLQRGRVRRVEDGAAEELEDFVNEEHWRSKQKDELPLLPRQRHDVEDRRQPRHLHSTQHASERRQYRHLCYSQCA
jgi:hypothetical protein